MPDLFKPFQDKEQGELNKIRTKNKWLLSEFETSKYLSN